MLAQRHRPGERDQRIYFEMRAFVVVGEHAAKEGAVDVAVLLLQQERGPAPPPKIVGTTQLTSDGLPNGSVVTDGTRLYFTEVSGDRFIVSQVSVAGGQNAPIPTSLTNAAVIDVASDSSQLLLSEVHFNPPDTPFWLQPLPAGSPRRLEITGHDATWMPDGGLLFARGNDILRADHNGANPRKLLTAPGSVSWIRLSPDGSRLRYTVSQIAMGLSSLWEARADGANSTSSPDVIVWRVDS